LPRVWRDRTDQRHSRGTSTHLEPIRHGVQRMNGYDNYCDHDYVRDDANCKVCLNCHKRKEISND